MRRHGEGVAEGCVEGPSALLLETLFRERQFHLHAALASARSHQGSTIDGSTVVGCVHPSKHQGHNILATSATSTPNRVQSYSPPSSSSGLMRTMKRQRDRQDDFLGNEAEDKTRTDVVPEMSRTPTARTSSSSPLPPPPALSQVFPSPTCSMTSDGSTTKPYLKFGVSAILSSEISPKMTQQSCSGIQYFSYIFAII